MNREKNVCKLWLAELQNRMKSGMTRAQAIKATIKDEPQLHRDWTRAVTAIEQHIQRSDGLAKSQVEALRGLVR